jgi:hypothetical protein
MTAFSPKEKLTLYLNSTADSLRALLAVAMAAMPVPMRNRQSGLQKRPWMGSIRHCGSWRKLRRTTQQRNINLSKRLLRTMWRRPWIG